MSFCPNCGAQLVEGVKFCTSCGVQVVTSAQPGQPLGATAQQQAYGQPQQGFSQQDCQQQGAYQQQDYQQQGAYQQARSTQQRYSAPAVGDPKFQSLGGWLLFFVVMWGISAVSGLGNTIQLLGVVGSRGSALFMPSLFAVLASVLSVALSVIMVVLVAKRDPSFLKWYQILVIASIALEVITAVVTGAFAASSGFSIMATAGGGVIGGAVGLLLMTLYFCKSIRVRTYMGSPEYQRRALFTLGAN